ncbi:MAG: ATP-binding protein [Solirubrobacteraceae bacterium]
MNHEIAARHGHADAADLGAAALPGLKGARASRVRRGLQNVDAGWVGTAAVAVAGLLAAAGVGYLTARNAHATPPALAVGGRIVTILVLVGAGLYAQNAPSLARFGRWLVLAGLATAVWLLNGSGETLPFSVGLLVTAFAPGMFCALLLMYPSGRLRSSFDRAFLAGCGGTFAISWIVLAETGTVPPLALPLAGCAQSCRNVLSLTHGHWVGVVPLQAVSLVALMCLVWGTVAILGVRGRSLPAALRFAVAPMRLTALLYAVSLTAWGLSAWLVPGMARSIGAASVLTAVLVPFAIVAGVAWERLYMGRALVEFVTAMAELPRADPQALMAVTLRDPSLQICYQRPGLRTVVNARGEVVDPDEVGSGRAVTWLERDAHRIAAVVYDAELADQERFIHAAGAAALMRLERAQLIADLKASAADVTASRSRLVETAYAERQRFERDLHDGVQQDLVAVRIKLDLAGEALREDMVRGQEMLTSLGRHMDDVLEALRALAHGIYPALLDQHGLVPALEAAARRSPLPVVVDAAPIGHYSADTQAAIYFACLEALQNAMKHAGHDARVWIRLWEAGDHLRFEVRDAGVGFDAQLIRDQHGLVNMRDRVEAVGGMATIRSKPGVGTVVAGFVPRGAAVEGPPEAPLQ